MPLDAAYQPSIRQARRMASLAAFPERVSGLLFRLQHFKYRPQGWRFAVPAGQKLAPLRSCQRPT